MSDRLHQWMNDNMEAYAYFVGQVTAARDTLNPKSVWYAPERTLPTLNEALARLEREKERAQERFDAAALEVQR